MYATDFNVCHENGLKPSKKRVIEKIERARAGPAFVIVPVFVKPADFFAVVHLAQTPGPVVAVRL